MKNLATKEKQSTPAEAKARQKRLTELDRSWVEYGRTVSEGLDRRDYKVLGYANAHEWMEATIPNSVSWIWKMVRIARALKNVPDAKLSSMRISNASKLLELPAKKRESDEWVDKAIAEPVEQFSREVAVERGVESEMLSRFTLLLPEAIVERLREAESKVARILSLDLEQTPGLRITVWEAIAVLINDTDESVLKVEIQGDIDGVELEA